MIKKVALFTLVLLLLFIPIAYAEELTFDFQKILNQEPGKAQKELKTYFKNHYGIALNFSSGNLKNSNGESILTPDKLNIQAWQDLDDALARIPPQVIKTGIKQITLTSFSGEKKQYAGYYTYDPAEIALDTVKTFAWYSSNRTETFYVALHESGHAASKTLHVLYYNGVLPQNYYLEWLNKFYKGIMPVERSIFFYTDGKLLDDTGISDYGRTKPSEDFAETWAYFFIGPSINTNYYLYGTNTVLNKRPLALWSLLTKLKSDYGNEWKFKTPIRVFKYQQGDCWNFCCLIKQLINALT